MARKVAVNKVKKAWDLRKSHPDWTHQRIADELKMGLRTIQNYFRKSWLEEKGLLYILGEDDTESTKGPTEPGRRASATSDHRPILGVDWPDITVAELVQGGVRKDMSPKVFTHLKEAEEKGNTRLPRFIHSVIECNDRWPNMPEPWISAVAGLPILAEDIHAPTLNKIAEAAVNLHPYLDRKIQNDYIDEVREILPSLWIEILDFFERNTEAGGFPIFIVPKFGWSLPFQNAERLSPRDGSLQNAIVKRGWDVGTPWVLRDINPRLTYESIVADVVSRLPNPAKRKGKYHKKVQFMAALYRWFKEARLSPDGVIVYLATERDGWRSSTKAQ